MVGVVFFVFLFFLQAAGMSWGCLPCYFRCETTCQTWIGEGDIKLCTKSESRDSRKLVTPLKDLYAARSTLSAWSIFERGKLSAGEISSELTLTLKGCGSSSGGSSNRLKDQKTS